MKQEQVLSAELSKSVRLRDFYNEPANKFVAGFIGSPAMNFFEVNRERLTDGQVLLLDFQTGQRKILEEKGYQGRKWYWAFGQRISQLSW